MLFCLTHTLWILSYITANAFDNLGDRLKSCAHIDNINAPLVINKNENYSSLVSQRIWCQKEGSHGPLLWKQKPNLGFIHLCHLHLKIRIDWTFHESGMCGLLQRRTLLPLLIYNKRQDPVDCPSVYLGANSTLDTISCTYLSLSKSESGFSFTEGRGPGWLSTLPLNHRNLNVSVFSISWRDKRTRLFTLTCEVMGPSPFSFALWNIS